MGVCCEGGWVIVVRWVGVCCEGGWEFLVKAVRNLSHQYCCVCGRGRLHIYMWHIFKGHPQVTPLCR